MPASFQAQVNALAEKYVNGYNTRDVDACSELYSEDAIVLLPGGIIRGREGIASDFQTLFKSGLQVTGVTTTHCHSEGKVGYAIQIEHSNRGDTNTLLVFRQNKNGNWSICAEAVIGNG